MARGFQWQKLLANPPRVGLPFAFCSGKPGVMFLITGGLFGAVRQPQNLQILAWGLKLDGKKVAWVWADLV